MSPARSTALAPSSTPTSGTHSLLRPPRRSGSIRERARAPLPPSPTDEVLGSLGPADPAFCETTPYAPNSPYSASKAASDHLVRAYHHTFGLETSVTNCSNNYGPYQFPEKLIPLFLINCLTGKPLPIYGDGMNVRDWLHVEDHCRGIALVLAAGAVARPTISAAARAAQPQGDRGDLRRRRCRLRARSGARRALPGARRRRRALAPTA